LLDLLQQMVRRRPNLSAVRGILFRKGGKIIHTDPAPLVTHLDSEMPAIAWDLLPIENYRAHNWHCFSHVDERQPYASLYTSLGCPFHCDFCCIQAPFKTGEAALGYSAKVDTYRMWSPEVVCAQIDTLVKEYGVKNIKFADELFVLNKHHVLGICEGIIERGYDLNIWAYTRVDSWNEKMLAKMKKAGINWLCLGIESGSPRVRNDVHKKYRKNDVFTAVNAIRKAGIHIIANYLFGLPEDDHRSMQETLDLAIKLNCEFANFYCAMAYPGSTLYERAKKARLKLPDSWSGYSQLAFDTLPLPTNYLMGEQVLEFRDQAFQTYFTNPDYLAMLKGTFGMPAVQHVNFMTQHKLKRKYLSN
jgi:radical SAM superfamily enzyme YgiQ (UPF0313 family)